MSTNLTLPKGFGAPSKVFGSVDQDNDELGAGIASSYGVIGYRGKVWSTKYQGKETPLMRDDGDGPRGSIEVVIVKAAAAISKIFYANGYQDGANAAPDCWSSDGVKPDASAQNKQHPTCAGCPRNAWGSRITESGRQGKQCADSRRIAVVPANDLANEMFGGPMLMRIPAASLKDLKAYGELLKGYGYQYYAVATRISFDPKEAYPKFVFSAIQPLDDAQAMKVLELRNDKRVAQLLNEATEQRVAQDQQLQQEDVPASPFEKAGSSTTPAPSAKSASSPAPKQTSPASTAGKSATVTEAAPAKTQTKATSKPAPVATEEVTPDGNSGVPSSFDALLEDII